MPKVRFGQGLNVIPVLEPKNIAATGTWTGSVDLDLVNWVTFVAQLGAISSAGASCADVTLTVVCTSLASTASATEIAFQYRLSAAVATNSWGAVTAGTSDGVAFGPAIDNMAIMVDVDPAVVAAKAAVKRFVSLKFTPTSTITNVAVVAYAEPRYPGNSIPSSS
jgi:hypothetical protein